MSGKWQPVCTGFINMPPASLTSGHVGMFTVCSGAIASGQLGTAVWGDPFPGCSRMKDAAGRELVCGPQTNWQWLPVEEASKTRKVT